MKKLFTLMVIVAAAAMVSCGGNKANKAAEAEAAVTECCEEAKECCGECEGECCKEGECQEEGKTCCEAAAEKAE